MSDAHSGDSHSGDSHSGDSHSGDGYSDEGGAADGQDDAAAIAIRLDALLSERHMTLTELSDRVGVTVVNLSVLKNGRARAIRFSTLARLCRALDCQPGDLLGYQADHPAARPSG